MMDNIWDFVQEVVLTNDWVADKFAKLMNEKIKNMSANEIRETVAGSFLDLWEDYDSKAWDEFANHVILPRVIDGEITKEEFKTLVRESIAIEKAVRGNRERQKTSLLKRSKQKLSDLMDSIF